MRILRYLTRTRRFSLLIVLAFFTVFGFIAKSAIKKQEDISRLRSRLIADLKVEDLAVRNETKAFSIIGVDKTPEGYIKIDLRNDYDKTIVAYQFSVGSTTTLVDSFTNAIKGGVEPGEVLERIEAIDVDPELMRRGIIVRAVVFNDSTADGNPRFIRQIHDFRMGEMLQTEQFLSSLSGIWDASGPEALLQLDEAKSNMVKLEGEKRFPADVRSGLRNMRLVLSREIEGVKNTNMRDRTSTMRVLTDRYQRKFDEIRVHNEKVRERQIQQHR